MHIYFSGIGGAGLGPLAEIAQDAGYDVSGSDLHPSLASLELERRDIDVIYEQTAESIAAEHTVNPIDWLVHTSALADNHPELVFAREHGVRTSKRDEFLAEFLQGQSLQLIAVAGTHGKTTTTGMLVWAFKQLGIPVSYSIGTTISFGPSGKFDRKSKYFIYEADEYDRNFLAYHPAIAVFPSVDYDHADIYPTVDDYKSAFRQFIDQSDHSIMFKRTFDYLQPLSGEDIEAFDHTTTFAEIALPGVTRRDDAYLVAQTLKLIGNYDDDQIYKVLSKFPGTNRRFEKLADGIYSDYAHHPIEIAATIAAALEVNPNVVAIYEPHQNMRQIELADQYKNAFDGVKHVYFLPTFMPPGDRERSDKILSPTDLIARLDRPDIAEPAEMNAELWQNIEAHIAAGDLVLAMSAGDLDAWLRDRVNEL